MLDDEKRLKRLEDELQGIKNGQQALREHIDGRIDGLTRILESGNGNQDHTFSAPVWAFIMLAASNLVIAAISVFFFFNYFLS